jgi:hypothetical protein
VTRHRQAIPRVRLAERAVQIRREPRPNFFLEAAIFAASLPLIVGVVCVVGMVMPK